MGSGSGCDSHVVLVGLYKLEGRGVSDSSSSGVAKSVWISSLRFQSKLKY